MTLLLYTCFNKNTAMNQLLKPPAYTCFNKNITMTLLETLCTHTFFLIDVRTYTVKNGVLNSTLLFTGNF